MDVKNLHGVPIAQIHEAFSAAFSDYADPFSLSVSQLGAMLERRGFDAGLSFGAFEQGQLAGFVLNGRGDWEGQATAYDTGTGVRPELRGQGVGSRLLEACLPVLREHGIRQYLLEVIRTNTGAFRLYRDAGFEVTREFDYWTGEPAPASLAAKSLEAGFSIGEIDYPEREALCQFWSFLPSWQNSVESIRRVPERFTTCGVCLGNSLVAYACMEDDTGDLTQFAVHPRFRRQGLGTVLVGHLMEQLRPPALRVINTCSAHAPSRSFFNHLGLEQGAGQFEMIRRL